MRIRSTATISVFTKAFEEMFRIVAVLTVVSSADLRIYQPSPAILFDSPEQFMSASMFYLLAAIVMEVVATTALKASESFTKLVPTFITLCGYVMTLHLFSKALEGMNIGAAYSIWAGLGIVLITISSTWILRQPPDAWGLVGVGFILVGVVIIGRFSVLSALN